MGEVETDEVMLIADSTYDIDLKPHSDQQLDTELQLTFQDATDDEEEEILPMEVAEPEPEEEALNVRITSLHVEIFFWGFLLFCDFKKCLSLQYPYFSMLCSF